MVPFLLLGLFSQKAARVFFISASVFLVLGDMLLLKYFSTAGVPLGADLFAYSIEEINQTVQSSGEMNVWPFIFMALFLVYMVRVFIKAANYSRPDQKKIKKIRKLISYIRDNPIFL